MLKFCYKCQEQKTSPAFLNVLTQQIYDSEIIAHERVANLRMVIIINAVAAVDKTRHHITLPLLQTLAAGVGVLVVYDGPRPNLNGRISASFATRCPCRPL